MSEGLLPILVVRLRLLLLDFYRNLSEGLPLFDFFRNLSEGLLLLLQFPEFFRNYLRLSWRGFPRCGGHPRLCRLLEIHSLSLLALLHGVLFELRGSRVNLERHPQEIVEFEQRLLVQPHEVDLVLVHRRVLSDDDRDGLLLEHVRQTSHAVGETRDLILVELDRPRQVPVRSVLILGGPISGVHESDCQLIPVGYIVLVGAPGDPIAFLLHRRFHRPRAASLRHRAYVISVISPRVRGSIFERLVVHRHRRILPAPPPALQRDEPPPRD